jgi:DHA1 family bicyclomycin/chloramphenicol resistance-like MFS transporter
MIPINRAMFLAIVTLCVSLSAASTDIFLPSLPSIGAALEATPGEVQLTLSAFTYAYAFSQLLYGPLTDRFGRRPVLLVAMGIYVGASIGATLSTSIAMLIAIRTVQALGACAGPVAGRAMVRDAYEISEAARALAFVAMAFSLTPICAPILGGFLETWFGWRAAFAFMAAMGTLVFVLVLLVLPETNRQRDRHALRPAVMLRNYRTILTSRRFLGYGLGGMFSSGTVYSFISGSPFVMIDILHLSPALYGPVFAMVALGYASGAYTASRLTPRWGLDGTIVRGAAIGVGAGLLLNGLLIAGVMHPLAISVPMMIALFGNGLVMPNLQAGAIGPFPTMAGAASAMLGFLQMLGAATMGVIVGQTYDGTPYPMTLAVLGATCCLTLAFYVLVGRYAQAAAR